MTVSVRKERAGNPLCWHCFNRLMYQKGGLFIFALVEENGVQHRVHKDCLKPCIKGSSGRREVVLKDK